MGPTVLVIEDADDVRESFVATLEDAGFQVVAARDGVEGLLVALASRPAVILLDLMMPVMDGFEFRREQQRTPEIAEVPVIIVTAHGAASAAATMGVFSYLQKPLGVDALVNAVRRTLGGG